MKTQATTPKGALTLRQLANMTFPLMLEGVLCITVGFVDTLMVSSLGESAISAVSTIDSINILLNELLLAIATGGTVVISQHLGSRQKDMASEAGKQALYVNILLGCVLTVFFFLFGEAGLRVLFPALEPTVFGDSVAYLRIVCLSYPFLALFHCGSAVYRAQGLFRVSMLVSLLMNLVNAAANAFFIFGCKLGVPGAAVGTVVARVFAALAMLLLVQRPSNSLPLTHLSNLRLLRSEIVRILKIGIPCGLENTLFHVGKIFLQGIIVALGTNALAANALVNNIAGLATIPANAFCIVILTLVGNCMGAGDHALARCHLRRVSLFCEASLFVLNLAVWFSAEFWVGLFGLSTEISTVAISLLRLYSIGSIFLWTPSFLYPSALRAAGDAKFTMSVSFLSMWLFRIGCAYIFVFRFTAGLTGIWICMLVDWLVRGIIFSLRLRGDKWLRHKIV